MEDANNMVIELGMNYLTAWQTKGQYEKQILSETDAVKIAAMEITYRT